MNLPPYPIFPTITGERILLRQIVATDMKDILEVSFYDAVQATNVAQAAAMQDKIDADYADGNSIHWGIADRVTHKIVGTCGYYRGFDKAAGELGCVLLPQCQEQGYMTEAMRLAIDFGWNHIGLQRIWAATSHDNAPAIRLLERLDFTKTADCDNELVYDLNL